MHRHSVRLADFDYSLPGAYFVTVVTQGRACLFGEVVEGQMTLNDFGEVAADCWNEIPAHFDYVATAAFGVMPNHIHGIVHLIDATRRSKACLAPTTENGLTVGHFGKPVPGSLPTVIGAYKSAVTKRINKLRGTPGLPVWQRNYYEHIIRSDEDYLRIEGTFVTIHSIG